MTIHKWTDEEFLMSPNILCSRKGWLRQIQCNYCPDYESGINPFHSPYTEPAKREEAHGCKYFMRTQHTDDVMAGRVRPAYLPPKLAGLPAIKRLKEMLPFDPRRVDIDYEVGRF